MKKISAVSMLSFLLVFVSCSSPSDGSSKTTDTVTVKGPDSAANSGIIPPSAAPGNAGNSSLADTTYHSKDSVKKK